MVDEVEVPHCEVGANREFGKIERSADASQSSYTLIQRPFNKQNVKPWRATAGQNVLPVAGVKRLHAGHP